MNTSSALYNSDKALLAYIDQLLEKVSSHSDVNEAEIEPDIVSDATMHPARSDLEAEVAGTSESICVATEEIKEPSEINKPLSLPAWGAPDEAYDFAGQFTGLLLDVHGIAFACPLDILGHPKPWPELCEPLENENSPIRYIAEQEGENRVLVDLAGITMPGRVEGKQHGRIIIPFNDYPVALIVTDVAGAMALNQKRVHWRDNSITNSRSWLAGMVPEARCALLEPNFLLNVIRNEIEKIA
ncbi:MAG: hypothetical protein ACWA5R_11055 [bacterium]